MTAELFVIVPLAVLATIEQGGNSGEIAAQISEPEQLAKVIAVSSASGESLVQVEGINRFHFMSATDARRGAMIRTCG